MCRLLAQGSGNHGAQSKRNRTQGARPNFRPERSVVIHKKPIDASSRKLCHKRNILFHRLPSCVTTELSAPFLPGLIEDCLFFARISLSVPSFYLIIMWIIQLASLNYYHAIYLFIWPLFFQELLNSFWSWDNRLVSVWDTKTIIRWFGEVLCPLGSKSSHYVSYHGGSLNFDVCNFTMASETGSWKQPLRG